MLDQEGQQQQQRSISASIPIQTVIASPTAAFPAGTSVDANSDSVISPNKTSSASLGGGGSAFYDPATKSFVIAEENKRESEPYHILTTDNVLEYVARTIDEWLPVNPATGKRLRADQLVSAEEVGDGNLNLVFRLLDSKGKSRAVLKQSLPYVRCVGESWPLTLDRNRLEADTLITHYAHAPATTEKVLFRATPMAVMVVEDLSDMVIWRRELVKGRHHSHILPQLADYLAKVHFHTSDFAQAPEVKKHAVQQVTNVDMCQITEDLFFADPFVVHERNNHEAAQEGFIESFLHQDALLKIRVAQLKHTFMNKAEAHLHGDIHSGSIFIDGTRVKAFDAEFGFYGPIGFDVGTVIGNLLINYVALPALLAQRDAISTDEKEEEEAPASRLPTNLDHGERATQAVLLASIVAFWHDYARTFLSFAMNPSNVCDVTFAFPGYADVFVQENVLPDTIGFAGSEMIRRTIGLAHVADLDGIRDDAARLAAKEQSLRLGAALIKQAKQFTTIEAFAALVKGGKY